MRGGKDAYAMTGGRAMDPSPLARAYEMRRRIQSACRSCNVETKRGLEAMEYMVEQRIFDMDYIRLLMEV